ncbi:MFS transporter [Pedococcus bigeumensis]|uniref:MFS transporter n=1 Tax=Pedococcus bigeumensis TaxID=433644 RepID=UPI0031D9FE97
MAVALAAADTYVVVLALTDMMTGVGLGIDALQKATPIISGFLLGYIAVLPLIGRLADLVARQRILVACLMIFVVGSAITALAVELPVLVTGRVLQGIGGGGLVPATLAIVADLWPAERRGTPLGVVGAVQEVGSVLGPVFGAAILAIADWRMIFWVNAVGGLVLAVVVTVVGGQPLRRPRGIPLALGALALVVGGLALAAPARLATDVTLGVPFVPLGDSTSRVLTPIGLLALLLVLALVAVTAPHWWGLLKRADLPGAVLLGLALGSVVLTFAASDPEREVVGPLGFALLPVGAVALGLYLWRHRTAAEPLVARGVVRGRARTSLGVSLMVGAALVAVIVDVPVLARLTLTDSQTVAAFVLVRFLLAVPVGALLGGWSLRRFGDGLVSGVGLLVATVGLFVMSGWGDGSLDGPMATVVLVLVGLGIGLALAPVNNAALADAPADAHGVASALVVVARMVGMVVGLALLTAIGLHRYYGTVAALPDQTDTKALLAAGIVQVQTVFLGAAVAALLGAVGSVGLGLTRRPPDDRLATTGPPLSTTKLG